MTQEEKQLLLIDLCGRLPYGVKMKTTLDLSYDTSYDSVEQHCDFNVTLYAINIDGDPTDILIHHEDDETVNYLNERFTECPDILEDFVPYLRPMSSMTEEEMKEYRMFIEYSYNDFTSEDTPCVYTNKVNDYIDWLNAHHFDYRGLIEKGLALEAPEGMYEIK